MYNKDSNCWKSEAYEKATIVWCQDSRNQENPEAMFILADILLEKASRGGQTADAVYLMEKAAKLGNARAALAMGQMFRYGWAVTCSGKTALAWFEKAARLGDSEAAALLEELKRRKKSRIVCCAASLAAAVCVICAVFFGMGAICPVKGVLVHEDTQLMQTTDLREFTQALEQLVEEYDDELVITGQRGSNRLMLRFEGAGIDLSDFPAAVVIDGGKNLLIVQFQSEEEARRCLEALKQAKGIVFVEEDAYTTQTYEKVSSDDLTSTGVPYTSAFTGENYYSWGVEYLGLDRMASWLMTQQTQAVTVAVLDTGCEPCQENAHLYLEGCDVVDPANSNGWTDPDGHGTHVAGTIIDCTWGLDVNILPVRVLAPEGSPTSHVVLGLQYAIEKDVDVINMSLGSDCAQTHPDGVCDGAKDSYIREAIDKGIVVVVAAGNGNDMGIPVSTMQACPAHIGECIVVAACDNQDRTAYFSNFGESVDVCAPGVNVMSYYPGGSLHELNGTSMAAPHISALAAMLKLTMPDKTPAQIEKYITDYCVDMGNTMTYGDGIPWAGYFAGD